jgi:hypothetical protein
MHCAECGQAMPRRADGAYDRCCNGHGCRLRQLFKNIGAKHSGKACRMFKIEMFLSRPFQWVYGRNIKRRFDGNGTLASEALILSSSWCLDLLSNIHSSRTVGI